MMKMAIIALFLLISNTISFSQTYSLKSYCIDNGGVATVTAGGYKMGMSVSQSFIGYLTGGNHIAYIGYWPPWGSLPGVEEYERSSGLGQPLVFSLSQNYPNPVAQRTIIKYSIASPCKAELKLFDVTGREVATLVNENQKPGHYQVNWDICNVSERQLPNGVYFYQLTAGDYTDTKKMIILR